MAVSDRFNVLHYRLPISADLPGGFGSADILSAGDVASSSPAVTAASKKKSGKDWVSWADANAKNSKKIADLEASFKTKVEAFIKALTDAGVKSNDIKVVATNRSPMRAYLFHWSWKIALGKCKPSDAPPMEGVDIEWDHGDEAKSKAGAQEMVDGFGLAVPPASTDAPSLTSNHIAGKAIDMNITWTGTIKVKKKDGTEVSVAYMTDVNANTDLHSVGKSYGVIKRTTDAPHWSVNGG